MAPTPPAAGAGRSGEVVSAGTSVNLNAARALALAVPQSLLIQASEVIR